MARRKATLVWRSRVFDSAVTDKGRLDSLVKTERGAAQRPRLGEDLVDLQASLTALGKEEHGIREGVRKKSPGNP